MKTLITTLALAILVIAQATANAAPRPPADFATAYDQGQDRTVYDRHGNNGW